MTSESMQQKEKWGCVEMIKVIKPRTRKNVECANCGAVLSYEEDDFQHGGTTEITSDGLNRYYCPHNYIICPECGEEVTLNG